MVIDVFKSHGVGVSEPTNVASAADGGLTNEWLPPAAQPQPRSFLLGLMVGFAGYVFAGLVFVFFALTSPADPHDRVAGALGLGVLLAILPTGIVPVLGIRWLLTDRRRRGYGALTGMAAGMILTFASAWGVLQIIEDWSTHCPCDPPVKLW